MFMFLRRIRKQKLFFEIKIIYFQIFKNIQLLASEVTPAPAPLASLSRWVVGGLFLAFSFCDYKIQKF